MGFSLEIDCRQTDAAIKEMERTSAEIMAQAVYNVLKRQLPKSQSQIKRDAPVRQQAMAQKVADSLVVEIGTNHNQKAEVRFGSDPIDTGGVTGSRGGKLAQYLEYGTPKFSYPFTFKTIKPSPSFGIGNTGLGHFINAKVHPRYPAYDGIGFLAEALAEVSPDIEQIIMERLQERFA